MSITLQCPRCEHKQTIDEDRAQGEVPCKICHHLISATAVATSPKPKAKPAPKKPQPTTDSLVAGPPPMEGGKPPVPSKGKPSKKGKAEDDDEEEDDRKRPAPRRKASSDAGTSMTYIMLAGGGVLVLALMCVGGGIGAYFMLGTGGDPPVHIVEGPMPAPDPWVNPAPIVPQPFPNPNPFPHPNPIPNPVINPVPPPPPPLDPNNAADLDRVLTALQAPANQRGQALNWLAVANTNHPRRAEVAKRLDAMVDEAFAQPFGNDAFFNAYFRWATKDSAPALTRIVENNRFGGAEMRQRQEAMRLMGKLKLVSAAPAVAKRLTDHFDRPAAIESLIQMGSGAEKDVLANLNHPDHGARDAALRVLQAYNTSLDKLVVQSIADFDSADNNRKGAALQWLVKNPVEPKRKTDVSKALNKLMAPDNCLSNRDLVVALEAWGTSENTPRLIELIDKGPFGNREAIRILGKIRDPNSVKAIAKQLSGHPFASMEARTALKDFGPAGEVAVIEVMNTTNDSRGRTECVRLLGEIGTKTVSLPALQAMALRLQQDRLFVLNVQSAMVMINKRGK